MPSSPPLLISLPCLLSYHRPLQPLNTPSFFRLLSLHDHLNPLTLTASPCTPPTQSSPTNSLTLSAPLLSPRPYRPPHSAPFSREPTPTTLHRFLPLLPVSPGSYKRNFSNCNECRCADMQIMGIASQKCLQICR